MSFSKLNRITIVGRPGSGKSTYAVELSKRFQIPVFHLDKIFFTDHWKERDREEFLTLQQNWIDHPQWILDGNSLKSLELRYQASDLIIVFLLPKWKCLWRIIQRRFQRKNHLIDDRASNCPEKLSLKLLYYTWTFEHRLLPILTELQENHPDVKIAFITSDAQKKALFNIR